MTPGDPARGAVRRPAEPAPQTLCWMCAGGLGAGGAALPRRLTL